MIKADVTLVGTIRKSATLKTDKHGNPYLSFVMVVNVPSSKGKPKVMDVLVNVFHASNSDLPLYSEKKRIKAQGSLDIRKKGEEYAFYLNATSLVTKDVPELDTVSGTLNFRGRLKNDNVCEEKADKNGKPYLSFSAYSAEKVGETFVSTWVRFVYFQPKDSEVPLAKPDWMQPKARIKVSGDFEISAFNDEFNFSCRVKEMDEYTTTVGNVVLGSARAKETLNWLS